MPYELSPHDREAVVSRRSGFTIRSAKEQDLSALAEVLTDSFHPCQGLQRWVYPIFRLGIYEDLRNRIRPNSPHYTCLVAVAGATEVSGTKERILGTVELALHPLSPWQPHGTQYPYISNLAVSQSCRRQGIAQQLLKACESKSLAWGFPDLYLHVLENNHQARQLYLKTGYQVCQVEHSYLTWLLRQPKRIFLHKHLHPIGTVPGAG